MAERVHDQQTLLAGFNMFQHVSTMFDAQPAEEPEPEEVHAVLVT
jgi:hypothetical protein